MPVLLLHKTTARQDICCCYIWRTIAYSCLYF